MGKGRPEGVRSVGSTDVQEMGVWRVWVRIGAGCQERYAVDLGMKLGDWNWGT